MKANEDIRDKVAYLGNKDSHSVLAGLNEAYYSDNPVWKTQGELEVIERFIEQILVVVECQKQFPAFNGRFVLDNDVNVTETN